MLKQRIITALVLLPLAIVLLFYPSLQTFSLILIPIFGLLAWEWSGLLETKNVIVKSGFVVATLAVISFFFYQLFNIGFFASEQQIVSIGLFDTGSGTVSSKELSGYPFKSLMVAALIWIVALVMVLLYPKGTRLWTRGAALRMLFGFVILPAAWLAVVVIRSYDYQAEPNYGGFMLLLMFLIIWGADVGAYFAGKTFGKHKLAPIVSPNKTWEGFFGGMVVSLLVAYGYGSYIGLPLDIGYFMVFVLILVLVSVVGDLFVSMLKRKAGVKDTSNILPGHGGLLDRLDSTLSVAPFFVVLLSWLKGGF